jgi:hypothetical protein
MPANFPPNSRYSGADTGEFTGPDGQKIVYLRRRFRPPAARLALLHERVVAAGERPDQIAAAEMGDPEQFWRICDANAVMRPEELTEEPGSRIRITLPDGIPGMPNA